MAMVPNYLAWKIWSYSLFILCFVTDTHTDWIGFQLPHPFMFLTDIVSYSGARHVHNFWSCIPPTLKCIHIFLSHTAFLEQVDGWMSCIYQPFWSSSFRRTRSFHIDLMHSLKEVCQSWEILWEAGLQVLYTTQSKGENERESQRCMGIVFITYGETHTHFIVSCVQFAGT